MDPTGTRPDRVGRVASRPNSSNGRDAVTKWRSRRSCGVGSMALSGRPGRSSGTRPRPGTPSWRPASKRGGVSRGCATSTGSTHGSRGSWSMRVGCVLGRARGDRRIREIRSGARVGSAGSRERRPRRSRRGRRRGPGLRPPPARVTLDPRPPSLRPPAHRPVIAIALGIPEGTVKSRLHTARAELAEALRWEATMRCPAALI